MCAGEETEGGDWEGRRNLLMRNLLEDGGGSAGSGRGTRASQSSLT